jgi:uncharacterized damage-inducible protein DinB
MELNRFLLEELEREAERSSAALAHVPSARDDWKPHDKSMAFGYLANLVASMPSWISMQLSRDELDVAPLEGPTVTMDRTATSARLLETLSKNVAEARRALIETTDAHLATPWRLKARGQIVAEAARSLMIQDTLNHWAHHRGQLTVYLRLVGATVPALSGPSADDRSFGPYPR